MCGSVPSRCVRAPRKWAKAWPGPGRNLPHRSARPPRKSKPRRRSPPPARKRTRRAKSLKSAHFLRCALFKLLARLVRFLAGGGLRLLGLDFLGGLAERCGKFRPGPGQALAHFLGALTQRLGTLPHMAGRILGHLGGLRAGLAQRALGLRGLRERKLTHVLKLRLGCAAEAQRAVADILILRFQIGHDGIAEGGGVVTQAAELLPERIEVALQVGPLFFSSVVLGGLVGHGLFFLTSFSDLGEFAKRRLARHGCRNAAQASFGANPKLRGPSGASRPMFARPVASKRRTWRPRPRQSCRVWLSARLTTRGKTEAGRSNRTWRRRSFPCCPRPCAAPLRLRPRSPARSSP